MAGSSYPGDQDPRDPREPRDSREPREPREPRDLGDPRQPRDPRDRDWDAPEPRDSRDRDWDAPEPREPRDARDWDAPEPREPRDARDWDSPEPRNPRDLRELREILGSPQSAGDPGEPRDARGTRAPQEHRPAENRPAERRRSERDTGREAAAHRQQRHEQQVPDRQERREQRQDRPDRHLGSDPRRGSRAAWWTPRNQTALAAAIVVLVIGIGGYVLRASQANGQASGSAAGAQSPAAASSGHVGPVVGSPSPTAASSGGAFSFDWVGDMTFGTLNAGPSAGAGSLLTAVAPSLHSDLTTGNLESALGNLPMYKCAPHEADCYEFETPASTAQDLKQDGFAAVNVANNHTLDAGSAGESNTNAALQAAGLAYAGRPGQITYLTRNGITIALLGFAPWSYDADALNILAAESLVRQAKQHAQVVIVMEHIGAEGDSAQHVPSGEEYFLGQDRGNPIAFTHGVIDAGADLVVGSGPHVLRGFQWYHGHLIAYSLGNFCGYNTLGLDSITSVSAILHVTLGAQGQFVSGSITPLRLTSPGIPKPDSAGSAITIVNQLSQSDFSGNGAVHIAAVGTIQPPSA